MKFRWHEPGTELYASVPAARVPWCPFPLRPDQNRHASEYNLVADGSGVGVARRVGYSEDAAPTYSVTSHISPWSAWHGALLALVTRQSELAFRVDQMPSGYRIVEHLSFPQPPEPVALEPVDVPEVRGVEFHEDRAYKRHVACLGERAVYIERSRGAAAYYIRPATESRGVYLSRQDRPATTTTTTSPAFQYGDLSLRESRIVARLLLHWWPASLQAISAEQHLIIRQALARRPLVRAVVGRLDCYTNEPRWHTVPAEQGAGGALIIRSWFGATEIWQFGLRRGGFATLDEARKRVMVGVHNA